jgi:hypothetical protein
MPYNTSPYAYCGNNPINRIDPWGLDWYWNNGDIDDITWFEGNEDREGFAYHSPTATGQDADYNYYYLADGTKKKEPRKIVEIIGYGNSWGGFGLWPENNYGYGDDDGSTKSSSGSSGGMNGMDMAEYIVGLGAAISSTTGNLKQNELFWRDAKGNFRSSNLLKPQANGKYLRGVQGLRNSNAIAAKAARIAKLAGHGFAALGLFVNAYDMGVNGINVSNSMDMLMIGVGFIPAVGWAISGTYFVADMITLGVSGQSISQNTQNWVESW